MKTVFAFLFFAAPQLWVVDEGTTFFDGSSVTGSFVWDADTETYSEVDLSTEVGFMISCTDVGEPDDNECAGFDFATNVDGSFADIGVTSSGIDASGLPMDEPNLTAFSGAALVPSQHRNRAPSG